MRDKTAEKLRIEVENALQLSIALSQKGANKEALDICKNLLTKVTTHKNIGLKARVLIATAHVERYNSGKLTAISKLFDKIRALYPRISDSRDRAIAARGIGAFLCDIGSYAESLEYLYSSKALFESIHDKQNLAMSMSSIAIVAHRLGMWDDALRYNYSSLSIWEECGDSKSTIKALVNISSLYSISKRHTQSIPILEKAIRLGKKLGDRFGMGKAYTNISVNYLNLGEVTKAEKYIEKALVIWKMIGNITELSSCQHTLVSVYILQRKYDKAIELVKQVLSNAERGLNPHIGMARSLCLMAQAQAELGKHIEAEQNLQRALNLLEGIEPCEDIYAVHMVLSSLYEKIGRHKVALHHAQIANEIQQKIWNISHAQGITAAEIAQTLYRLEKQHKELEERATKAEEESNRKEQQLQEVSANLDQSVKKLKAVEEKVKPYLENAGDEAKELAKAIYQSLSSTMKSQQNHTTLPFFDKSYQMFIQRLHTKHPKLTATEIKVCILIKLDYSNKQIGDLLNVSDLTVKTHRARIRKKMNLHPQENLLNVLLGISS